MTRPSREILAAADSATELETSPDFDYEASLHKVWNIKHDLDALCDKDFIVDDQVQDATYFATLYIAKRLESPILHDKMVFAVAFSCFGNLFTLSIDDDLNDIPTSLIPKVIEIVEEYGFTYVDSASLDTPYDGLNPAFANTTWRHRYFDYL